MGRIPCGMRGLKFIFYTYHVSLDWSHSLRNAWIEISLGSLIGCVCKSHSLRNAWIEIFWTLQVSPVDRVAFPAECVD